MVPAPLTDHRQ